MMRVLGDHVLYRGDCLEVMAELPDGSVDLILTDPPYGTTACKWDSVIPFEPMWVQLKRIIKPNGAIVLTASQPFTSALIMSNIKMFKYCWVWDKRGTVGFLNANKRPLKRHEDVLVFSSGPPVYFPIKETRGRPRNKGSYNKKRGDGDMTYGAFKNVTSFNNEYHPTDIIEISNAAQKGKLHPTQKPVPLMEYMIKTYTHPGETVLDFTMGSGTTGVACVNTGRKFIGIEQDGKYFDIATGRILEAMVAAAGPC